MTEARYFSPEFYYPMDNKNTTTRKGFMQKAGLALAGVFSLAVAPKAKPSAETKTASVERRSDPFKRIRPARGAVQRKV